MQRSALITRARFTFFSAILVVTALGASVIAPQSASAAIDYANRQRNLVALSNVFGELHHLRRMCEPARETDLWRERMKQLVSLERPTKSLRNQLVSQFNTGYRSAQRRFSGCTREARTYAATRASEGRRLSSILSGGSEG